MNPTELEPFVCKSCPAILNDECALKTHQLIHTKGESDKMIPIIEQKSYKCDSCASAFSSKNDLDDHHESAHTGGKLFKCNFCQSAFNKKGIERHEDYFYRT